MYIIHDRSRHIATMADDQDISTKKHKRGGSLKNRDVSVQHGRRQRVSRQRSICSPRRVMNSPPPRPAPPLYDDIMTRPLSPRPASPSLRPFSSPPPRRVSTPLYVIGPNDVDSQELTELSLELNSVEN